MCKESELNVRNDALRYKWDTLMNKTNVQNLNYVNYIIAIYKIEHQIGEQDPGPLVSLNFFFLTFIMMEFTNSNINCTIKHTMYILFTLLE